MGNAMARFMTEGAKATEALEKAKMLNANNPRIYILEGQDKFYTPEQFGGSKDEAKKLFEKANGIFMVILCAYHLCITRMPPSQNIHKSSGAGCDRIIMDKSMDSGTIAWNKNLT